MLTVAIPGVMNFSFVVPIDGIPELCVQLPKCSLTLRNKQLMLIWSSGWRDASTELRKLEVR